RLGHARHPLEQHVAAAQQRDHEPADHGILPDHGLGDLGAQRHQLSARVLAGVIGGGLLCHDWVTCLSMSSSSCERLSSSSSDDGDGPKKMYCTACGLLAQRSETAATTAGASVVTAKPRRGSMR